MRNFRIVRVTFLADHLQRVRNCSVMPEFRELLYYLQYLLVANKALVRAADV